EPEDVAVLEHRLAVHARVVDVDAPRAPRVVDLGPGQVEPDPRVDGAHAGHVEAEPGVGVGTDEDLVDGVLEQERLALQRTAEDRQAGAWGRRVGHRSLGPHAAGSFAGEAILGPANRRVKEPAAAARWYNPGRGR